MAKIRLLRSCLADWHEWKKLRLRSALSVNRSLGTESCRAILFWAMKFCSSPPIHFNWWTLYPKFRVYGTAAILSRTAKFIAYLRFVRWQRAVVRGRSCYAQATVLHQAHIFSFVSKHFTSWYQQHYAHRKGCKSMRLLYWKIFRSRSQAQIRLRALRSLVNARLLSSAIDYFALAVFRKDNVVLAHIPDRVVRRIARSFLLPDNDCVLHAPMQKYVLRRLLQGMIRSWLLFMFACQRRRLLDRRNFFFTWRLFVHSAQNYREEAGRRHEQLQRLCSISQRVDKRLKCMALRHLHALCQHRRNVFSVVASASSRFQVLCCIKTLRAVSRHNLAVFRSSAKLRLRVACCLLRPIWRGWNRLVSERAHRKLWDRRECDSAFQCWLSNATDSKQRRAALEVLQLRVVCSRNRYFFAHWQGVVESSVLKQSASESFFKDRRALQLKKLFVTWRYWVFRLKWDHLLVSSCCRTWRGVVKKRNERVLVLKSMLTHILNEMKNHVFKSWRDWQLMRLRRRTMGRKIESKRSTSVSSNFFSRWSAITQQARARTQEQYQDALIFRSEVLVRAFYMRWRQLQAHLIDCAMKSLASIARRRILTCYSLWSANTTASMTLRLRKMACTALALRNLVISSFRLWRLFAFSHSHVKRHVAASDVASAVAHSGRAMLSSMTASQRSLVMLLPRVLQVAFAWFSQQGSNNIRASLLSCSADRGFRDDSLDGDSSSHSGDGSTPLSISQLFASQASSNSAIQTQSEPSLEWHRPNFGAQTSFKIAEVSSRNVHASSSQTPQARAAQLQQMLDELYGKSESP
jgi:hypothetical protein